MKESVMRSRPPRRAVPGAIAAGVFDLSVHFEGLANPTRLAIVKILARRGEVRVSELAELCKVSQPRMSWHLRTLRHAQVVSTRRDGREVLCRPRSRGHRSQSAELCQISRNGRRCKARRVKLVHRGAPAPVSEEVLLSNKVRVAIIGVGNCASSFVQGVQYYRTPSRPSSSPA